jgi:hypothetical protein
MRTEGNFNGFEQDILKQTIFILESGKLYSATYLDQ